jgi:uncharacterized protein
MSQLSDNDRRQRAHHVIDRLMRALLAHDMSAFADEWAPDGTASFPFAPPGWPNLSGRQAVRGYLADYTDTVDIRAITHQTRHDTTDPDTVIVEFGLDGVARKTGNPYDLDYVVFITVGAEGIVTYRDYWNPLAVAAAMGGFDDMIAAFSGAASSQG